MPVLSQTFCGQPVSLGGGPTYTKAFDRFQTASLLLLLRNTTNFTQDQRRGSDIMDPADGLRFTAKFVSNCSKRDLPSRRFSSCRLRSACLDAPFAKREPLRFARDWHLAWDICVPWEDQIPILVRPSSSRL